MIFSPRILLGPLMAMGIVSGILQAGPRYGQRYTPVADIGLEVLEILEETHSLSYE